MSGVDEPSVHMEPREPAPRELLPGSRYQCVEYLNRGANGFVVMAVDSITKKRFALKFIPLNSTKSKYVEREIINQFKLKHPHIIKLEELFVTEDHLVLVLEYADRGDLFTYVKAKGGLTEDTARWYFQQLILAVDFCHKMDVVNRDIKLENILLTNAGGKKKMVKLSDFGFSKDMNRHSAPSTRIGTVMYIAPEIIMNERHVEYDARMSDVWSCGVVLYVMLTCRYPFKKDQDSLGSGSIKQAHSLVRRTMENIFDPVLNASRDCNALLRKMLDSDPNKRISIEELMKHPWFLKSLNKGVAKFNDQVVKQLTEAPRVTDQMVVDVRKILRGESNIIVKPQTSMGGK
ncbi:hypothetical protein M9435_006030 [Picochlorum sp. BPE23]|nr:hypothetical protein M9435_006030 [Picochlorum sp. BPE23]